MSTLRTPQAFLAVQMQDLVRSHPPRSVLPLVGIEPLIALELPLVEVAPRLKNPLPVPREDAFCQAKNKLRNIIDRGLPSTPSGQRVVLHQDRMKRTQYSVATALSI